MKETASKTEVAATVVEPEACKYTFNRYELEKFRQNLKWLTYFFAYEGASSGNTSVYMIL